MAQSRITQGKTNNLGDSLLRQPAPGVDWQDTHSDPRSGLPLYPQGTLGAGGIPAPTPLLPVTGADHAQLLIAATLSGAQLPGTTRQDVQDLYLSHSPNWLGTDPAPLPHYDPYQPPIGQQATDISGTSRPDRNR